MALGGNHPRKPFAESCLSREFRNERGFALISVLALMALLALLVIGILQLSTVSLRSLGRDQAMAEARANARVALQLAISQLQMQMGPDQRISANAGILDSAPDTPQVDGVNQPHYTGVWNAEPSRLGDAPDAARRWTLDQITYDKEKKSSFRTWLVSGVPQDVDTLDYAKQGPASAATKPCEIVSPRSQSDPGVNVSIIPGERSGLAWWTADNGAKALLRATDPLSKSTSKADVLLRARAENPDGHAQLDARIPDQKTGLNRLVDLASVDNAVPDQSPKASVELIHDLTTFSESVPVDVTKGELKKCLNLKLDTLSKIAAGPWSVNEPRMTDRGPNPQQYPLLGSIPPSGAADATKDYRLFSWEQLRNYESLGRAGSMVTMVNGRPQIRTFKQTGNTPEQEWNPAINHDRFRIQPVLLKLAYVISYATEQVSTAPNPAKPYAMRLYIYPIAVLWNPYNVDLLVPEYNASGACHLVFDVNKGQPSAATVDLTRNQSATCIAFGPEMKQTNQLATAGLTIPAGSTRILCPQPVRWDTDSNWAEHRHGRFIYHYYTWAQATAGFDLGPNNYGGIIKNLKGNTEVASRNSIGSMEIWGAEGDPLTISVSGLATGAWYSFGATGGNTDWWGNNGSGTDSQGPLQQFGAGNSLINYRASANSPQMKIIPQSEIPVWNFGALKNRPTPLLYYEVYRKPADEALCPAKHAAFSLPGAPLHPRDENTADNVTPWFERAYSYRFEHISNWMDVTKYLQMPITMDRAYFGNSYSTAAGQIGVVDQEIPLAPLTSIAQLQHLPLFDYFPTYDPAARNFNTNQAWWSGANGRFWFRHGQVLQFGQNHAIGNSYASPGIPMGKLSQSGWPYMIDSQLNHLRRDRSYIANSVLWDGWFCSSIAAQDGLLITGNGQAARATRQVAVDFFNEIKPLANDSICLTSDKQPEQLIQELFDADKPKADAYEKIAAYLRIRGGFNINSVSETAWAHFLSNLLSRPLLMMESKSGTEGVTVLEPENGKFLISRELMVNAPPAERGSGKEILDRYWNGPREVTKEQIEELASVIVKQVKKRGPFLSLSEFVNRRLTSDPSDKNLALCGAMQSALDDPACSINSPFRGDLVPLNPQVTIGTEQKSPNYAFPEAAAGPRRQGINGYVTQADILSTVGNSITPRSDTLTVRAMGEVKSEDGKKVIARAWCEAVVQRSADFMDPANEPDAASETLNAVNKKFGRRFEVISFRWLNAQEL